MVRRNCASYIPIVLLELSTLNCLGFSFSTANEKGAYCTTGDNYEKIEAIIGGPVVIKNESIPSVTVTYTPYVKYNTILIIVVDCLLHHHTHDGYTRFYNCTGILIVLQYLLKLSIPLRST